METIRILVADDHLIVREGVSSMLNEEEDFDVIAQAQDGADAVQKARELQPDVAILDLQMPELNGGQAMQIIRTESPNTKFVVLTMYDSDEYILMGLEAGADAFLLKDTPRDTLFQAVRAVHRGEQLFQSRVASKVATRFVQLSRQARDTTTLSERELEVLKLVAQGASNKKIASQLSISERTAKKHITSILQKLDVCSRAEALAKALQQGIVKA